MLAVDRKERERKILALGRKEREGKKVLGKGNGEEREIYWLWEGKGMEEGGVRKGK